MTSKRRHRGLEFRTIAKSLLQNIINPDKRGPNLDLKGLLLPYNRTCLHQLWWCWCQCLCLASFCRLHKMVFVLCLKGFSSVSIPSSQGYLEWRQQDLLLPLLSRHYQVHTSFLEFHVKKPGKKQFIKRPLKSASWRLPADSFVRFHRLLWLSYRQINDLLLASMRLASLAREPHSSFCISIESQKSVQKILSHNCM